jgi:hypothetical protein
MVLIGLKKKGIKQLAKCLQLWGNGVIEQVKEMIRNEEEMGVDVMEKILRFYEVARKGDEAKPDMVIDESLKILSQHEEQSQDVQEESEGEDDDHDHQQEEQEDFLEENGTESEVISLDEMSDSYEQGPEEDDDESQDEDEDMENGVQEEGEDEEIELADQEDEEDDLGDED